MLAVMTWILRPAKESDAAFCGWAAVMAARSQMSRGWFDIVLEREETFVFAFAKELALAKARSWWHWSLFHVAEVDGEVVSAMCGFGDNSYYYASRAAMAEASDKVGLSKTEQAELWPRGSFIAVTATSEPGAWTIENVATLPAARGSGVSGALLDKELDVARAAGFKRAQVSFFIGNTRAARLYEKAGFAFAEERRSAEFEAAMGTPGTIRYVRDI